MSAMPTFRAHTLLVGGDDRPPISALRGWPTTPTTIVFARHLTTASRGRRLEHGRTDGNDSLQRAGVCRPRAEHPTRAFDASVALRTGVFGPEEYGIAGREPDCLPSMADLDREEGIVALSHWAWNPAWHVMSARPVATSPPPMPDADRHGRHAVAQAAVRRSSVCGRSLGG
jgi:hypothetical protein